MPVILGPKPGGDVIKLKKNIFIKPQNRLAKQNRVGSVLFPTLSSQPGLQPIRATVVCVQYSAQFHTVCFTAVVGGINFLKGTRCNVEWRTY